MERLGAQRAPMFSWEKTAAKTLDLYYEIAGAGRWEVGSGVKQHVGSSLMKYLFSRFVWFATFFATLANSGTPGSVPAFENEQLRYSINWPSGLSLGEAQLGASRQKTETDAVGRLHFTVRPGCRSSRLSRFGPLSARKRPVNSARSSFRRTATHGPKKTDEKETFDPAGRHRNPRDHRRRKVGAEDACLWPRMRWPSFTSCASELSQGRMPPTQTVFFGAAYEVRLDFAGTQSIKLGDKPVEADRVTAIRERCRLRNQLRGFLPERCGPHAGSGARSTGHGHVLDGACKIS